MSFSEPQYTILYHNRRVGKTWYGDWFNERAHRELMERSMPDSIRRVLIVRAKPKVGYVHLHQRAYDAHDQVEENPR